jgi:hypothetical protein
MTDILQQRVSQVRRRLFIGRVLAVTPWCATVGLAVAAGLIALDKYRPLGVAWPVVLAAAVGAALVAALAWAWFTRVDELQSAVELDRRCRLQERVSSALALERSGAAHGDAQAAAALAAVENDAAEALRRVDVARSFPIGITRRWAAPLVPLAAAIALALWLTPAVAPPGTVQAAATNPLDEAKKKEAIAELQKKLSEKKDQAEILKLAEAENLLEQLREEARRIESQEKVDQKEALVKLNDLGRKMEERRNEVAGAEQMRKQLSRLQSKKQGPADKFAEALNKGNFQQAKEQIEQLREQLKSDKLGAAEKKQLADQLDQLQKQVDQLAKAQEQQKRDLEDQVAKQNQSKKDGAKEGDKPGEAGKNGKQDGKEARDGESPGFDAESLSEKLADAQSQQQALDQLSQAMQNAAQGMQSGDAKQAQQALDQLSQQMNDLARQSAEQKLLDGGLQDLADCKSGMCQGKGGDPGNGQQPGDGDQAGNGGRGGRSGQKAGQGNQGGGVGGLQAGRGQGPGVGGDGGEPEAKTFDSRVAQQVKQGQFRVMGPTDGPNAKGRVLDEIRRQAAEPSPESEAATLENQALDRSRRRQKRQYFDTIRKGE